MKNFFLLMLVSVFLLAGKSDSTFNAHGVSFSIPKGWKIKAVKDHIDYQLITISKKGLSASGLVTITIFNQNLQPHEITEPMLANLAGVKLYHDFNYSSPRKTNYGKYSAVATAYSMSVLTIGHRGIIYVLQESGKTICILQQEADEDVDNNLHGFTTIRESFIITQTGKML